MSYCIVDVVDPPKWKQKANEKRQVEIAYAARGFEI